MTPFEDIVADFAFLEDWDDRYKYIIDLGRTLEPYPEERRDEAHKVKGCASQVWLTFDVVERGGERVLRFRGALRCRLDAFIAGPPQLESRASDHGH